MKWVMMAFIAAQPVQEMSDRVPYSENFKEDFDKVAERLFKEMRALGCEDITLMARSEESARSVQITVKCVKWRSANGTG